MKYIHHILLLGCTILTKAVTVTHKLKIYEEYLLKFDKPISRLHDPVRIASFFDSLLFVYRHQVDEIATNMSFATEMNQMSDWLEDEIKSRFVLPPISTEGQQKFITEKIGHTYSQGAVLLHSQLMSHPEYELTSKPIVVSSVIRLTTPDGGLDNLNWASSSNPKGMSVLSSVRNQVILIFICNCW